MSREGLKKDKAIWPLVRKMEHNTSGVVKLVSAMQYVVDLGGDASTFNVALFDLLQQRRNLRVAFEAQLKRVRGEL